MLARILAACLLWTLGGGPAGAQRLPDTAIPEHYTMAFDVDLARARFTGSETIHVRIPRQTTRIVLHAAEIDFQQVKIASAGASEQVAEVTLNGQAQTATLAVARPVAPGQAEISLRFAGRLNDDLRGFYLSHANNRRYAVTQLESTDARRAFPCFDEPVYKATFDISLTLDHGDTAISNGRLLSDTPGPGEGRHTLKFATSPKMSSYLVAMAVGDFKCLSDRAGDVPIRICTTPDKAQMGRLALDWAKRLLTFFNGYFAIKYPFEKLDVVAVPDFAAGAMENTAAIFYRESSLLTDSAAASRQTEKNIAEILSHEMAHQWFGNLVTMRWWDDLWLNEGFATWMESVPLATLRPDWEMDVDDALETRSALGLDSLRTTRAIRAPVETPDEIEALFDTITYEKGASVMRMLEAYLGREAFRDGVNAYLARFAYGNATSADFWTVMTASSRQPVDRILPTFVNQPGAPLLEASASCRGDATMVTVTERRFFLDPKLMKRPDRSLWQVPICIRRAGESTSRCHLVTRRTEVLAAGPGCANWTVVNAGARSYVRVAYAPEMLRKLTPVVAAVLTAPERLALAADTWDLVRAGQQTVSEYFEIARQFNSERVSGVLGEVTRRLQFIHDVLAGPDTRPRLEAWVGELLGPLYAEVGPATRTTDSESLRALRAVLLGALGGTARDRSVIAEASNSLDRALAGGAPLDPATADAIVNVAAQHGDARLFDALVSAADRASSPDERDRYLLALGSFEAPPLIDRGLQRALSPELKSQDTARYLARFLGNPAANERSWRFVKEHWNVLEPKLSVSWGLVRLVEALDSFCTTSARDDIRAFFASRNAGPAAQTLEQTLEAIASCAALKDSQGQVPRKWVR